jgi:hypothetical protein
MASMTLLHALHVLLNCFIGLLRSGEVSRLDSLPKGAEVLNHRAEPRNLRGRTGSLSAAAGLRRSLRQPGEVLLGRRQIARLQILPELLKLSTPAPRVSTYAAGLIETGT